MSKAETYKLVVEAVRAQTDRLVAGAAAAQDGATSDEVKSEGKYDTRGAEASYLAAAQAAQAEAAAEALVNLGKFVPRDFDFDDVIEVGALVECERNGVIRFYFLLPQGGGVIVEHDGFDAETLSPDAPLFQSLLGKSAGEALDSGLLILGLE